jgi:nitrogen regulatory protein P-II 1
MKKIESVIKSFEFDGVKEALHKIGLDDIVAIEVKHFGQGTKHREVYRGAEYIKDYDVEVKIELILDEDMVEKAVQAIRDVAQFGRIFHRNVFVLDETGVAYGLGPSLKVGDQNHLLAS